MAGRIKGITVEINGDTTGLSKALSSVNKQIKDTQSQLKDVEKLLKLDPGNTELLAQKHRLLGDAVAETKEKLATLKAAAEQANDALARGDISQEQYDGLQREIFETEQALKALEKQANQSATAVQKIGAAGENLKEFGGKVTEAGKAVMPLSAGVAALGTIAVKTAADFDSAMSQVAAVSGATGKDLEALRDKAREMGSKTKFSASEAAEAMNYMAMAGWKTGDMLGGIEGIMNLAAASGESLATTSDIVTDALTAFGLTAADSGHFADVLAAASSNANTNVSMMGETFKYAAPVAGALGFSIEDTAEAIGLMANSGIKASQAGTALRSIMTNLAGEVKLCGDSIGEVTIATTNADGSMRGLPDILADCRVAFAGMTESEKAAAAEALVGKNAMSGFLALMNAAPADIDKLSGAIDNCNGKSAEMAGIMQDNLAGQLTILKSQLEELAISFGEMLMPVIRSVVSVIQSVVDWLNNMDEGTRKVVLGIGLFIAALGPVLITVGKLITAVGTIMTIVPKVAGVISSVKTAFAALNITMLANPIVLVIAAITALVAAFIYFWNTSDGFRQFWIDLWENIKSIAISVGSAIGDFLSGLWDGIWSVIQSVWNGIGGFFSGIWGSISDTFSGSSEGISASLSGVWTGIKNTTSSVFTSIGGFLKNTWNENKDSIKTVLGSIHTLIQSYLNLWKTVITAVLKAIQAIFQTVFGAIERIVTAVVNGIVAIVTTYLQTMQTIITSILNAIQNIFTTVWNAISRIVTTVLTAISNIITTTLNTISTIITAILTAIQNVFSTSWNGIQNVVSTVLGTIANVITNVWNGIKSTVGGILSGITNSVSTNFGSMHSAVSSKISSISNTISSGMQNAASSVRSVVSSAWSWGSDLVSGIASGIRSSISKVTSAVSSVASTIRSYLHFSVPDVGPLTEYESWMPDFMQGLAEGIEKSRSMVERAVGHVANDMMLNPTLSYAGTTGNAAGATGAGINVTVPLLLDGKVIATATSTIQSASNASYRRSLGVV